MKFRYVKKDALNEIPKTAGVYSFWAVGQTRFGPAQELLYIGKAGNLKNRVGTHFQQSTYRDNLFIGQVTKIGYLETASEIEALLLESRLIKQYEPKYNVMWKDDKNYFYVAVTNEKFPRVLLTHQKKDAIHIGPFVDGKPLKRALRTLRRIFPYYTVRNHALKPCQYCHLGLCPGPDPNEKEYKKTIKNLTSVLEGKRTSVLKKLQKEMALASKHQDFEKAGTLRDQMKDLEIIFAHARILRPEEEKTPLEWGQTEKYLQQILGTAKSISRVEAYDISNIQGVESTGSMPVFIDGKPAKQHYKKFKVRISGSPNDFAMMEEVLTRRLAHKEWGYPDLIIIDGGKGQLSSALKAFKKLHDKDAQKIHVAAIAKKNNELFLPGRSKPLLLRDMPSHASNLILHIRDEAHRFAITYHRKLRRVDLLGKKN